MINAEYIWTKAEYMWIKDRIYVEKVEYMWIKDRIYEDKGQNICGKKAE